MEKNFIIVHIHKARLLKRGDSPPQSEGGKFTNDFFLMQSFVIIGRKYHEATKVFKRSKTKYLESDTFPILNKVFICSSCLYNWKINYSL